MWPFFCRNIPRQFRNDCFRNDKGNPDQLKCLKYASSVKDTDDRLFLIPSLKSEWACPQSVLFILSFSGHIFLIKDINEGIEFVCISVAWQEKGTRGDVLCSMWGNSVGCRSVCQSLTGKPYHPMKFLPKPRTTHVRTHTHWLEWTTLQWIYGGKKKNLGKKRAPLVPRGAAQKGGWALWFVWMNSRGSGSGVSSACQWNAAVQMGPRSMCVNPFTSPLTQAHTLVLMRRPQAAALQRQRRGCDGMFLSTCENDTPERVLLLPK